MPILRNRAFCFILVMAIFGLILFHKEAAQVVLICLISWAAVGLQQLNEAIGEESSEQADDAGAWGRAKLFLRCCAYGPFAYKVLAD